jgi:hypothetical protein
MTNSSFLGGERAVRRAKGKDVDALGPSDSSDSGSDVQGEGAMATAADEPDELGAMPVERGTDSDARGTGERGSATGRDVPAGADIAPDHIVRTGADGDDLMDADGLDVSEVDLIPEGEEDDDAQEDLFEEPRSGPRR